MTRQRKQSGIRKNSRDFSAAFSFLAYNGKCCRHYDRKCPSGRKRPADPATRFRAADGQKEIDKIMKATGIVRRIDELGRVVIPKEIRKTLRIKEGDPLELFTERDELIIKKYSPLLNTDGLAETMSKCLASETDHSVLVTDNDAILFAFGPGTKDAAGKAISPALEKILSAKNVLLCNAADGAAPVEIVKGDDFGFANEIFLPVLHEGDARGLLIVADKRENSGIASADIRLAKLAAEVLSAHIV